MGDCTLDKKSYKDVIADDIKLVKQYIPDTFMLKTHILAVLEWSIDKAYPPDYWDRIPCPDCKGEGYSFFVNQGEPDPDSECSTCHGRGTLAPKKAVPPPPEPPPPRLIKEGGPVEEPPKPAYTCCSELLPDGFVFSASGRVILDPKKYPNPDEL